MKGFQKKIRALVTHPLNALPNGLRKNPVWRALGFVARRPFFLGISLGLFLILLNILPIPSENPLIISESELHEKIRVNEIVRLSDMPKKPTGTVCILDPYSPSVRGNLPRIAHINAYIKSLEYRLAGTGWGLVFAEDDAVAVLMLKQYEKLAIGPWYIFRGENVENVRHFKGFKPVDCALIAHASIVKINLDEKIYITLGEKK